MLLNKKEAMYWNKEAVQEITLLRL